MTRIEDQLRKALAEEADATSVDVLRMRDELNDRLEVQPLRRRRSRTLPAAAAAVLLVGGTVVGIQTLRGDSRPDSASQGKVDSRFSCPENAPVDLSGAQDEFLPDLIGRTPAQVAREHDAPRWDFVEDGNTALLRLGNADGTLGSETRYRRQDGAWQMVSSVACGNGTPAAPTSDALRLGLHVDDPYSVDGLLKVGTQGATAVLVDDRPVYDYSGLTTRHRAITMAPCGPKICFMIGDPDGVIAPSLATFSGRSEGLIGEICSFYVPDDMVGRTSPYRLIVGWDALGTSTRFAVRAQGETYEGQSFSDPSWGSQEVWLAVVPSSTKLSTQLWHGDTPQAEEQVRPSC